MNEQTRKLLAVAMGVLCTLTATIALAGVWSSRTSIDRIIVRDDQAVIVFRASAKWKNPDLCDSDTSIVLLPPGAQGAAPAYKEIYASLLGAHLTNRKIKAFLKGCTRIGNKTFPVLTRVTVF